MNEIVVNNEYNDYPQIITFDKYNPTLRSPYAPTDLSFYHPTTKELLHFKIDLPKKYPYTLF